MTKLTLEELQGKCCMVRNSWKDQEEPELYNLWDKYAALCRSAQAVIEAAKVVDDAAMRGLFAMSPVAETYFVALQEALAAHARNEQGTGP